MRLIIEVKNPTEELTSIYFITLVVGYFAIAQNDVEKQRGIFATLNMSYFLTIWCIKFRRGQHLIERIS